MLILSLLTITARLDMYAQAGSSLAQREHGQRSYALCLDIANNNYRARTHANIHLAKHRICARLGCGHIARGSYTAIWPTNSSSWCLDCRFLLKEAFLAKSTSCIARKYLARLKNGDNFLHKPGLKVREPGQTDRQTDRQTTITLSRMRRGLMRTMKETQTRTEHG